MERIIKQTREVGTSAGVLLPRSWLNKQVIVTLALPSKKEILQNVFDILWKYNLVHETKGVYLIGSYGRKEQNEESDIDVLVITERTKIFLAENNYEILCVPEDIFAKELSTNLHYMSALFEIEVLMNRVLIEKYIRHKPAFQYVKYLDEIKRIMNVNRDAIETCERMKKNIPDGIMYSLEFRLRELDLIKHILLGKKISKKEFVKNVGEENYSAYIRVKLDKKERTIISPHEARNLLDLSERWLAELKERKKVRKV